MKATMSYREIPMRRALALLFVLVLVSWPVLAQSPGGAPFKIDFDSKNDVRPEDRAAPGGENHTWLNVRFTVSIVGTPIEVPGEVYKIIIEENGIVAMKLDVPQPAAS